MRAYVNSTSAGMLEIVSKNLKTHSIVCTNTLDRLCKRTQGFANVRKILETLIAKYKTRVKISRRESQYLQDNFLELINQLQLARFRSKFGRALADHAMH